MIWTVLTKKQGLEGLKGLGGKGLGGKGKLYSLLVDDNLSSRQQAHLEIGIDKFLAIQLSKIA